MTLADPQGYMGTWAIDSFGNDDALDWIGHLEGQDDLSLVEDAIQRVLANGADYLEAPEAAQALVAAEAVAAALGNLGPAAATQKGFVDWLNRAQPKPYASLVASARAAVDRIAAENSELNELWEETEDHDAWLKDVESLQNRLGRLS